MHGHVHPHAYGGHKRVCDPLELEFVVAMSCLVWVMGTELGTSDRAVSALKS